MLMSFALDRRAQTGFGAAGNDHAGEDSAEERCADNSDKGKSDTSAKGPLSLPAPCSQPPSDLGMQVYVIGPPQLVAEEVLIWYVTFYEALGCLR